MNILLCPRCGREPVMYKKYREDGTKVYKVACNHHQQQPCRETAWQETKDLAISLWSKPAGPANEGVPGRPKEVELYVIDS